jgi:glycosyltransferase involved in cell wall biosynthesis
VTNESHRALRVCLWAPLPPPNGGISRWTLRYLNSAAEFGIEAVVVNTAPRSQDFSEKSRFTSGRAIGALVMLMKLGRVLWKQKPEVCHVTTTLFWATPRDAAALFLCRVAGVPTILNIRASTQIVSWRKGMGRVRRRLFDSVLRSAKVTVVLSAELRDYLQSALPDLRVVLIPNMVDADEMMAITPSSQSDRCSVLFVGFRTPLKGLGDVANAVREVENCDLVIAGGTGGAIDPAMAVAMEEALRKLDDAGRLRDLGALRPDEVTALYHQADIFVLPSYREGLPNVLLEAMAAGLPCIATPVGAIPDVLADDCGALVPVGNVSALREWIRRLSLSREERLAMGLRGRDKVLREYGTSAVMKRFRSLYEEVRSQQH